MARQGLLPIATAVTLSVAAVLSITAEHARSSQTAALGAPFALPTPLATGEGKPDGAVAGANGSAPAAPSVGSRALTGNDETCPPDKQP